MSDSNHPVWGIVELLIILIAGLFFTYLHADSWDDEWKVILEIVSAVVLAKVARHRLPSAGQ